MFSFDYLSAEEDQQRGLLKEGTYKFYVKSIIDKQSKSGNKMKEVVLAINDDEGKEHSVWDYFTNHESMKWKARHFLYSIGLGELYESKQPIDEQNIKNKKGVVTIGIDASPGYKAKNKVIDYLTEEKINAISKAIQLETETGQFFNDEIPF